MSLMERDYMKETYEDRKKARIERIEKEARKAELWYLYGKKHKTIFDKMRIKEIEQINLQGLEKYQSKFAIRSVLILLFVIIVIFFILFLFYNYYII